MCRFQFLPKVFMLFYYFCNGEILSHRFRKSQYEIMYFFFHCFLLLFPDTAGKYHFLFLIAIHIHKHKIIEFPKGVSIHIPSFLGKINFRLSFIHFSSISKMSFL